MIYIIIKNYSEVLAKRQPWYTVRELCRELQIVGYDVLIINDISELPSDRDDLIVIKVFSLKDIVHYRKYKNFKLLYLMTFSIYPIFKIMQLDIKTIYKNFKNIDRILIMSFLPKFMVRRALQQAEAIISISDRSYNYLKTYETKQMRFIPFAQENLKELSIKNAVTQKSSNLTWGYFGPAYQTRCFDEVSEFALKLLANGQIDKFKFVIRNDGELDRITLSKIEKLRHTNGIELDFGFFTRDELKHKLENIDVFLLPFKIVMAEFPVVVLEALAMGKIVVTNNESGILSVFSDFTSLIPLDGVAQHDFENAFSRVSLIPSGYTMCDVDNRVGTINSSFIKDLEGVV